MKEKESFILYNDFYEPVRGLSAEEKGMLFDAVFIFHIEGREIELPPHLKLVFGFFKNAFSRDYENWLKTCNKNKNNALKRWNATACDRIRSKPTHAMDADNDNDNDNDNDIKREIYKEKRNTRRKNRKSKDIPAVCYEISDLIKKHCEDNKRVYQGNRNKSADIIRLMGTQDNLGYDRIKQEFTTYMQLYTGGKYDPEIFSCRSLREKWNSVIRFNERNLSQEQNTQADNSYPLPEDNRENEIDERYNRQMAAFEEACRR